ncbi:MAG: hypothetical protein IT446_09330 [Phycisphaerales bacterium]|jgi:chromosome segregation ATPase|nr:hypothetical protein [Phycisphaerales bacterium]
MPRHQKELSINELEQKLNRSRSQLNKLMRKRMRLQTQMDALDREIKKIAGDGSVAGAVRTRAKNSISLADAIAKVLENGKPAVVSDVARSVRELGYRSSSPNFRAIVNQTLIKDKRFVSGGRGLYQLKK